MRLGARVTSMHEDDMAIYTTYTDSRGVSHTIRSQFVVGADGKTGFVRKQYLEPLGVTMAHAGTPWEQYWVAMNWKMTLPTPTSHPHFPLWEKGYTPQQVYDSFFPSDFRFLCNPARAAVCGRFGLDRDRLWRFEFAVQEGENPEEMANPDKIRQLVHPYITHPASRYGLSDGSQQVTYPLDCVDVLRCRPFHFSARSCNKWALGRAILCGDAAHVFPPFGGQGIASGFRDAISLAWRLRLMTLGPSSLCHREMLQGWFQERKQQLEASLQSTVENGNYVTEPGLIRASVRDWSLWAMQIIPSWRHWQRLGNRRDGMTQYEAGGIEPLAFVPGMKGGKNFPQVYVTAAQASASPARGRVHFSDDIIFSTSKRGVFQVVALLSSHTLVDAVVADLRGLEEQTAGYLLEAEVSMFSNTARPTGSESEPRGQSQTLYRSATASEFVQEHVISRERPEPLEYNPQRIFAEFGVGKYIILRPDRFVFAVCSSRSELMEAAQRLLDFVERGSTWL